MDGGTAVDARLSRKFSGFKTSLRASVFSDFESQDAGFADRAKTFEGEFRGDTTLHLPAGPIKSVGLGVNALHTTFEDKTKRTKLGASQSF